MGTSNGVRFSKMIIRKCIKVISGNKFVIDKPIDDNYIIQLIGVKAGDVNQRKKLTGLIEGKNVEIEVIKKK